jgi:hypothetical protein
MSGRDWRIEDAYSDLEEVSLRGLAWEYLRRNPGYIAHYRELTSRSDSDPDLSDAPAAWGLRFRGRSELVRHLRSRLLDQPIYLRHHHHIPPGQLRCELDAASDLAARPG